MEFEKPPSLSICILKQRQVGASTSSGKATCCSKKRSAESPASITDLAHTFFGCRFQDVHDTHKLPKEMISHHASAWGQHKFPVSPWRQQGGQPGAVPTMPPTHSPWCTPHSGESQPAVLWRGCNKSAWLKLSSASELASEGFPSGIKCYRRSTSSIPMHTTSILAWNWGPIQHDIGHLHPYIHLFVGASRTTWPLPGTSSAPLWPAIAIEWRRN